MCDKCGDDDKHPQMRQSELSRSLALLSALFRRPPASLWKVRFGRCVGAAFSLLGARTLVRAMLPQGEFFLDARSRTEAELLWNGEYDPSEVHFLASATPSGGVFLDIGANVGMVLVQVMGAAPYLSRAVAVEPVEVNFSRLRRTVALRPEIECDLLRVALGDRDGQLVMVKEGPDGVSDNAAPAHLGQDGEVVPMRRLDSVVPELGLVRLDTIKIDVEGFEAHVFQGGRETIRMFRPVVYGEFNNILMPELGVSFRDVWSLFSDLDYVACGFQDSRTLVIHEDPDATLGNAALIPRARMDDLRAAGYVFV